MGFDKTGKIGGDYFRIWKSNKKNMGVLCCRKVNGDYFYIKKLNSSQNDLEFYTSQFNPDDYYIYKQTKRFREVSKNDFLSFKYMGYMFYKKELFDKKWLDMWILWLTNYPNSLQGFTYLIKPLPPFNPEKIKIY